MGVDIAMAFDECPAYGIPHAEVERSMELTHRWARRSLEARDALSKREAASGEREGHDAGHSEGSRSPALFGIVQGGIHHDLRQRSAEAISAMPFDGVAIRGGSGGGPKGGVLHVMGVTGPLVSPGRPRYLMGGGGAGGPVGGGGAGGERVGLGGATR